MLFRSFFGAVLVLCVYAYIIYLGIKISMRARSSHESLLSLGIVMVITLQTLLNIAVVTGSIPPTGLPLPFVSHGGSSLVVFFFAVGVLVKIASNSEDLSLKEIRIKGGSKVSNSMALYDSSSAKVRSLKLFKHR